jgi:hypothetical protein
MNTETRNGLVSCWAYDEENAWPCWADPKERVFFGIHVRPEYRREILTEMLRLSLFKPVLETESEIIFNCDIAPSKKGVVVLKLPNGRVAMEDWHSAGRVCTDRGEQLNADGSTSKPSLTLVRLINMYKAKHGQHEGK